MSNKDTMAKAQKNEETQVVSAQVGIDPAVKGRMADFTDPSAADEISKELDAVKDRINQLASMAQVFDDDDEEAFAPGVAGNSQDLLDTLEATDEPVMIGGLDDSDASEDSAGFSVADDDLTYVSDTEDDEALHAAVSQHAAEEDDLSEMEGIEDASQYLDDLAMDYASDDVDLEDVDATDLAEEDGSEADHDGPEEVFSVDEDVDIGVEENDAIAESDNAEGEDDIASPVEQFVTDFDMVEFEDDAQELPSADEANESESSDDDLAGSPFDLTAAPRPDWMDGDGFSSAAQEPSEPEEETFEDDMSAEAPEVEVETQVDPEPAEAEWTAPDTISGDYSEEEISWADETEEDAMEAHSGLSEDGLLDMQEEQEDFSMPNAKNDLPEAEDEAGIDGWMASDVEDEAPGAVEEREEPHDFGDEDGEELPKLRAPLLSGKLPFYGVSAAVIALMVGIPGYKVAHNAGLFTSSPAGISTATRTTPATPTPDFNAADTANASSDGDVKAPVDVAGEPAIAAPKGDGDLPEVADSAPVVDTAGDLADLVLPNIPEPKALEPTPAIDASTDGVADIAAQLDPAKGDLDQLFLTDQQDAKPAPDATAASPLSDELLADMVHKKDLDEVRSAIDLLYEKIGTLSDEVVERDQAISDLKSTAKAATERAARAEQLALAQNEVLADFVRLQEKVDMAESLIVDLSKRLAKVETTDPADKVAVDRSIGDINTRLEGMARDIGLVARLAINGNPGTIQSKPGSAKAAATVPGGNAVFEKGNAAVKADSKKASIPADIKVGAFVEGYGSVLDVIKTSDGGTLVVMENGSVLLD